MSGPQAGDDGPEGEEPRWLTGDEQRIWRTYLWTSRLLDRRLDADLQAAGVRITEYEILAMLSEQEGRAMRMFALADLVVQSRSRLTHTAVRLEKRGWVRRRRTPDDLRGVELYLTDTGVEELLRLVPAHVVSVRRHLVDALTPEEFAELGRLMARIAQGSHECPGPDAQGDSAATR